MDFKKLLISKIKNAFFQMGFIFLAIALVISFNFLPEEYQVWRPYVLFGIVGLILAFVFFKIGKLLIFVKRLLNEEITMEETVGLFNKSMKKFGVSESLDLDLGNKDIPNGIVTEATVTQFQQGNTRIKKGVAEYYEMLIDVEVHGSYGSNWPARIKRVLPLADFAMYLVGTKIKVKYDPNNKQNVILASVPEDSRLNRNIGTSRMV